jgi:hypothetical protein
VVRGGFWLAGENGSLIDKADRIAEGIFRIEPSLAPFPNLDPRFNLQATQFARPPECSVEIRHGEVDMIRIWPGVETIAVAARIKAGEDDTAAVEIMPTGADALAGCFEEFGIEAGGFLDIADRKDNAVNPGHGEEHNAEVI